MNKYILFLIALFFIGFVYAVPDISFQKQDYQTYETILIKIENVTKPLSETDVHLFENRREMTITKKTYFYKDTAYVSFLLGKEGSFSLEINNIPYLEKGVPNLYNYKTNMSIKNILNVNNKTEILGINPAVVISDQQTYEIYFTNYGSDKINFTIENETLELNSGQNKKLSLAINNTAAIPIKSYFDFFIPVYYTGENITEIVPNNNSTKLEKINIAYSPSEINASLLINESFSKKIDIKNNEPTPIIIEFIHANNKFETIKKTEIKENDSVSTYINFSSNQVGTFFDVLIIQSNKEEIGRINLEAFVFNNETEEKSFTSVFLNESECVERQGKICAPAESCEGSFENAGIGKICCYGQCSLGSESQGKSPKQTLLGIGIVLIVGIFAFLFYRIYKKAKLPTVEDKFKKLDKK